MCYSTGKVVFLAFAIGGIWKSLAAQELAYSKAVRESEGLIKAYVDGQGPLKQITAYKWANAATTQQVGHLVLYLQDDNRPVASSKVGPTVARFAGQPSATDLRIDHVVVSMTDKPLECKHDERILWTSPSSKIDFVQLDHALVPDPTEQRRIFQARTIARDFSAQVDEAEAGHANAARHLRLLPTPIHRYGSQDFTKQGTICGDLFLFVIEGGNPQAILLLEAVREKGEVFWQYGMSRRSVSGLTIEHQGIKVWEVPRIVDTDRTQSLFRIRDPTPGKKP